MKLVTFTVGEEEQQRVGAVLDDGAICEFPSSASAHFTSMLALIDGAEGALDLARDHLSKRQTVHAASDVRLLAPLPEPRQMRDALCFEKHLRQARANRHLFGFEGVPRDPAKIEVPAVWYEQPIYYKANRFSVVGTETDITVPRGETRFDYELELGLVISRKGKDIRPENAREHMFGFCIFNDYTARTAQLREMTGQLGPAKGKDFDTGNALGPWLVTADEIADPHDLTMVARVNGEEWSRGNSGEMHHKFPAVLAHISSDETLHPGEFIGSGTVGSGCGLELGKFLNDGDVVELEIEGLGILRNRVVRQDGDKAA
ncbi:fumarylacetoacetate hydrolase family protein [Mesorhizobium sp. CAU 1741]|uniref:fumarylacetoacetate hydrolase family protein n=1 Tax=Mesorhizobium sp. CAU 1741 TaxID=3140366 RepID=UPI00325B5514